MKQEYSSKDTSISVVNKVYKQYNFRPFTTVLDYGGGKYDKNKDYMKQYLVKVSVYDKYNRSEEENRLALSVAHYDYLVCSNVLNVIKEDEVIDEILKHMLSINADLYLFTVYEGDKSGSGKVTKKGYQRNQKLNFYYSLLEHYFSIVSNQKGILVCKK